MTAIEIQPGQTVWDVVLSQYGHIDGIAYAMADNDFSGEFVIGSVQQEGQVMKIRDQVIDKSVVDYLSQRQNTTY